MKNIFKCSKCKGQKVRTRTHGMICLDCKPPRTGRVEKKGDREKLEKVLMELNKINDAIDKVAIKIGLNGKYTNHIRTDSSISTMTMSPDSWSLIKPKKVNKKK